MRSFWGLIILLMLINVNFKKIMYDSVNKQDYPFLAFKTFSSTLTQIINSFASKYIPLTIIGVVNNLSPMVTVLFAFIFLGERLRVLDLIFLGLLAAGIFTVVLGASKTANPQEKTISQAPWLYVALFLNPFLVASGTIISRKLRHIHEYVNAVYVNLSTLIFNLAIMLSYNGKLLPVLGQFSPVDWIFTVMQGVCSINNQVFRFKALQNQQAAKLQYLNFVGSIFSYFFDEFLFHISFTLVQYIGLGWVLLLYLV